MQLGLAHRALQAEQQPVVEVAGVVEAVLIQDEGVGEGADLQQAVPVRGVARQAQDLEAEHHAHLAQSDGGDQALEALAVAVGARESESPRSQSMTTTCSSDQPRATALSFKAYWRLVLSVFSRTWRSVD